MIDGYQYKSDNANNGTSQVTGKLSAKGKVSSIANTASSVSGKITGKISVKGYVNASTSVLGKLKIKGKIKGLVEGSLITDSSIQGKGKISGLINCSSIVFAKGKIIRLIIKPGEPVYLICSINTSVKTYNPIFTTENIDTEILKL